MSSVVDICNQAISEVGGTRIISLSDNTAEAKQCSIHYEPCLRKILTERFWSFAKKRAELAPSSTEPLSQYSKKYKLPSDCLVVRVVSDKNGREYRDWQTEEGYIYCNENSVFIEYTTKSVDTTQFSPSFEAALVYLLASRLAIPIAANRNLKLELYNIYKSELEEASPIDGMQGSPKTVGRRSSRLLNARWRGWQR